METTLVFRCCRYFPLRPAHQSPLSKFNNTRTHVGSPMRDPTPTVRFVSSNIITNSQRFGDPRRLLVNGFVQSKSMATKLEKPEVKEGGDNDKKKEEEDLTENLPPPPEKPEPGDCCGSGCVRCVWDVYYEELDAYNKLKSDSMSSQSKSS